MLCKPLSPPVSVRTCKGSGRPGIIAMRQVGQCKLIGLLWLNRDDCELLIRRVVVGYCSGIRSERVSLVL